MVSEAAMVERSRLLGVPELSAYLGVPIATLYVWRTRGEGPRGIKVGRHVRYRPEDIERWLEERSVQAATLRNGAP
ncbi:helix-turn-helix domain-containing protein [soil metagenome]